MSCTKQTFSSVTQAQFDCLLKKAAENNLPMNGFSGKASQSGFTVSWTYNAANQTLDIQCLEAPFLVPCSVINGRIHDMVEGCLG